MTLQPGSLLNQRYRIEEVVAQGGMGALYRAFDLTLNIEVAVKENFFTGENHARQFRLEAIILAGLRHPNLPRVTDHFTIEGEGQYLVMDYIDGADLREMLREHGPLPEAEVVRIGAAVCEALDYLHARQPQVVHRDIKPGNIKVSPGGGVYLVDFGLAKISQSGEHTTSGAQALTPGYAPPEQYGQGTEPRSDIYSLGATLYAALTGQVPEDAMTRAMGIKDLTPIREHRPDVTLLTATVIQKAMELSLNNRYQTGAEFSAALLARTGQADAEEQAQRPSQNAPSEQHQARNVPAQAYTPAHRSRPRFFGVVGVSIAVVAILGFAFFIAPVLRPTSSFPPNEIPTRAIPVDQTPMEGATHTAALEQTLFSTATTQPAVQTARTNTPAPTDTPLASPTPLGAGAQLAFVSDRTGLPQIWSMLPDGKSLRQVTDLPDGACQPDWDPTGTKLVFVSPCREVSDEHQGSSLHIINADGTGLLLLPTLPGGDFDPAWSPNGQRIAFTSLREGRANLFIMHLSDNRVERLSSPVNYERHPAWSPDGQWILYETNRPGFQQIWIMGSNGEDPRAFSSNEGGTSATPAWSPDAAVVVYAQGGSPTFLVGRQYGTAQAHESRLSEELFPILNPVYSPDGAWIALDSLQEDNRDIYILMPNGGSITRLTNHPAADYDPAWK